MIEQEFYSEQFKELDRSILVRYNPEKENYVVSGLAGEDKVTVRPEELHGTSSVDAYQNALETEDQEYDWSSSELESLI